MKSLVILDSIKYTRNNCFLSQLYGKLNEHSSNFSTLELLKKETFRSKYILNRKHTYSHVIIIARQRTIAKEFDFIVKLTNDMPVVIYDQDPWQSYIQDSESYGLYSRYKNINLVNFITPSLWWANFVAAEENLPMQFLKMGMNAKFVSEGKPFSRRSTELGFKGTLRPHRIAAFKQLESVGLKTVISKGDLSYNKYLKYLRNVKIFVHDESDFFVTKKGKISMSTAMWWKDFETASQGTFSLRNYHEESNSYNMSHIPTVMMYENCNHAKDLVLKLRKLDPILTYKMQVDAINYIKSQNNWEKIAERLLLPNGI